MMNIPSLDSWRVTLLFLSSFYIRKYLSDFLALNKMKGNSFCLLLNRSCMMLKIALLKNIS
jgi:hypothetical protein